ncbi:hypothetical protein [Caloramator fervidus]|jgi:RecA/RadA recombinase|nr:hypothetical protein [Caloramator fervidus]
MRQHGRNKGSEYSSGAAAMKGGDKLTRLEKLKMQQIRLLKRLVMKDVIENPMKKEKIIERTQRIVRARQRLEKRIHGRV